MDDWVPIIKSAVGLIAIVNPPVAVPVFLSLTTSYSAQDRRHTAVFTGIAVFAILFFAAVLGEPVLNFLGIRFSSFRVGGGILLLLMAIAMLHARATGSRRREEELEEAETKSQIAVVPLAMPILAGPGAISLVILDFQHAAAFPAKAAVCCNILLVAILVWIILAMSQPIARVLGKTGINIVTRFMGLLLAALAVELIATGAVQLFPGLA